MKRLFVALLVIAITGTLIAPVMATESESYKVQCEPYLSAAVNNPNANADYQYYMFDSSSTLLGISGSVQLPHSVNFPIAVYNTAYSVISTSFILESNGIKNIKPGSLTYTQDGNTYTYDLDYITNGGYYRAYTLIGSFQLRIISVDDDIVSWYVNINQSASRSGTLTLNFDLSDFNYTAPVIRFTGQPPVIVSTSDASNADIIAELQNMATSSGASSNDIVQALAQTSADITTNATNNATQITASADQIKQAVDTLEQNMSSNISDGMQDYFDKEEKETVEEGNKAVTDIIEKLPLINEANAIQDSFDLLMNILADTGTNVELVFPAGTVFIAGETFTFWDETPISMNHVFANEHIQLLLLGFRFVFGFGFIRLLLYWINKIIGAILLEDKSTENSV